MKHSMSVRKIKGMYNSTVKSGLASMGLGVKPCKAKKEPKSKPEPAVDRNLRVCRKAVDDAGRHFHDDPTSAKTFKALKKKLDTAQKHLDKAYAAWSRKHRCD